MNTREAVHWLEEIISYSPGTVIDPDYIDYLDMTTLIAILCVARSSNYDEVLEKFEGFTLEEMLNDL